jgi:two-component system, NtrC family, sensor kinase
MLLAYATRRLEIFSAGKGTSLRLAASYNTPAAFAEVLRSNFQILPTVTKSPIHRVDLAADQRYLERNPVIVAAVELGGIRTNLIVPMLKENELIGTFVLNRQEVRSFTEKQIAILTSFAAQAVIAIENARLLNELRESLLQQTATADVLKVISRSTFDLQAVLDTLVQSAARLCEADTVLIGRPKGESFQFEASYGYPREYAELVAQPVGIDRGSCAGRALLERKIVHVVDSLTDPEYTFPATLAGVAGSRTLLGVPLLREGSPIGVMTLGRKSVRPFIDKQIELAETFADQAVIAIENTRLFEAEQQRTRELTESLEQQTATSEVLQVISSSPGDLEPVFGTMLTKAVRICDARFGNIFRWDGDALHLLATHNVPIAFDDVRRRLPLRPSPRTPIGRMVATKTVVHVTDLAGEKSYIERAPSIVAAVELGGIRTFLAVPMLKEGELIGAFTLNRPEVRPFTEKEIALVTSFAAQAVIAIENARLLSELRQRTDELGRSVGELRALGEVSQAVNSTLDIETVLPTIVAKAVQLSGTDAGAIYVFDELEREFRLRATYGMDQELIDALRQQHIGMDEPNVERAFAEGEPIQVADLREDAPSPANEIVLRAGYRARLAAPLMRGEEIVGMLVVRRRTPGAFPPNIVDLMKTFAAQSALAIENARLFNNVETSLKDLRTAQDRLVQTEKLASLGQLTAGIAHEIKNPLNFVNNFSAVSVELIDELREALGGAHLDSKLRAEVAGITDMLQGNLDKVVQHGKRADSIVKNMLLHSRQGSGEHRPVDINALVEESVNLAYHGARAEKQGFNITLERSFDPAAGEVNLFPQEITRVLLNLISNGFYAATKRKAEANRGDYEPTLAAATKNLGDRVEIRIRDNGTGIPPEVQEKLFNPFFTTKPAGEGTGLGLSISHDIIVKQHGGSIEVDTQPGEFTEFRIILPRAGASLIKSGERA